MICSESALKLTGTGVIYIAILCNSTVIELCEDIIRICQRLETCQL
jgi:hypothetical protein